MTPTNSTLNLTHSNGRRKRAPWFGDTVVFARRRWTISAIGVRPPGVYLRPLRQPDAARDQLVPVATWRTGTWNFHTREWEIP